MHPISPPTSPKISNLAQNDRQSSFGSDTTLIPTRSAPGLFIRPTEGRDCGMACRCKCHIKITRQWPQVLQSSSASDIIGMMSRPSFVHRCSDRTCKARQGVRVGAVYITPPWLRRKAVSISILLQGLKIERHLRSHSIVAESSDVVRYAIKGDINGLRRLFSQRAASVHDSTLDGWSLLHVSSPLLFGLGLDRPNGSSAQHIMVSRRRQSFCYKIQLMFMRRRSNHGLSTKVYLVEVACDLIFLPVKKGSPSRSLQVTSKRRLRK